MTTTAASSTKPLVLVGALFALATLVEVTGHATELRRYLVSGLVVTGWIIAVRAAPRWGPRIAFVGTLILVLVPVIPALIR